MSVYQVRVEVESLFEGEDFSETLTRAKFEELNMDLFRGTLKPVQKVKSYISMSDQLLSYIIYLKIPISRTYSLALNVQVLEDADLTKKEVDEIVLVRFFSDYILT